MTGQIITIRHHVTESGKRGYRWRCGLCLVAGVHCFNRWTDHVEAKYGRQAPHPQQRCMDAADRHVHRYHRPPQQAPSPTVETS